MENNEKKPGSVGSVVKDLAQSTASGMQSLAKKTAKGAQNIAKSTTDSVKQSKAKKETAKLASKDGAKKSTKKSSAKKSSSKKSESKSDKKSNNLFNLKFIGGALLRKMAFGGAKRLGSNAEEVNKLNIFPVPDGDTGDNMKMTIESGIAAIENIDSDDLAEVMRALSHGMLLGARGNSGVILSQFFAGTAKGLEKEEKADPATFGRALENGVKQAYSSVMTPTEGTILTVAREAVEYAVSRINENSTIRTLFADLVKEMHASLDRTPEILSVLKEAGVVDSGGAGLLYIMDGFNRVLNGEEIDDDEVIVRKPQASSDTNIFSFGPDSVMEFGYCTECLLRLQNAKTDIEAFDIEELKKFLASLGDSVVAFKNDSIVKLHVHTFTPEKVLEYCRNYGEFLTIKIENMSVQHSEISEKEEKETETAAEEAKAPETPAKRYGMVAVSNGPGVDALFGDLGVDCIVEGGQTQNPSTNDFLDAFAKVNAEHIFVFPNNGNIFMAASQAADLWENAEVHVIPSKNIGMGYVAMSSADLSGEDVEAIIADMTEAMKRVTTGYISPSIRDADMNGVHINNGDTIGIIDKEIVLSEAERKDASFGLVCKLLDMPEKFMLTVFVGADATEEERAELESFISEKYPDDEVYFIDGGQDIYPFIFVAE